MSNIPAIISFLIVGLAELGDKTQLLTIGFASTYSFVPVASAIIIGSFLLNLIAAAFGHLAWFTAKPFYIQLVVGLLFIIFGLWQLRPEKDDKEKQGKRLSLKMPPFLFILISFMLAEFGDKTQLTTFALAMKYKSLWEVGLGAGLGMACVNLMGLTAAKIIFKNIPPKIIHYFSAAIFIIFGIWTLMSIR